MGSKVKTEKELGKKLKDKEDTIEIEGDLKNKVMKIKATGKVSWAVALAAIIIAVGIFMSSGGTGAPVSSLVGAGAVSVLGLPAATSAVLIAVAGGGAGVLNQLRDYKIIHQDENKLILKRK